MDLKSMKTVRRNVIRLIEQPLYFTEQHYPPKNKLNVCIFMYKKKLSVYCN